MIIDGEDYSELRNKHIKIEEKLGKKPVDLAFLISQPTPKALALILSKGLKSGYIVNGEGAQFLNSARFADSTPRWNDIWSGSPTSIDTPNDGKIDLSDSSLSAFIAVQDTEFLKFVDKRGSQLAGNGFFQRLLFCWPESNIGYRDKKETDYSLDEMQEFNSRLTELLNENLLNVGENPPEMNIVEFSAEAEAYFKEYSDEHEYELRPGHRFAKEAHLITKMPENVARVSANLHIFEYGSGKISLETLKSAIEICSFYYSELCRILILPPLHETDAAAIDGCFTNRLRNHGVRYAFIRSFRPYLPEKLRKDPRFANAILHLHDNGKIAKLHYCGNEYVDLHPTLSPDPVRFEYELGWIRHGDKVHKLVTKFPSLHIFEQAQRLIGAASGRPSMFTSHDDSMPPISPFFSVPKGANNQHDN
jgi:hypothetical protein